MKKLFMLVSIIILAFNLNVVGQKPVQAAADYDKIATGEYNITAKALHETENKPSGAASFIKEEAKLTVSESKVTITLTVPHNDMAVIAGMQIEGKEPIKKDGEQWTYELHTVSPILIAQVQYEVPMLNMKHDVPFRFALEGLDALPEQKEPEEEPSKDLQLEDGLYAIDASFINVKNGSNSAMASYLGNQAYIDVKNGQATVYFLINDNETVTKLTVNGSTHTNQIVNGKQTLLGFPLNPVTTELAGFAEYQAPFNGSVHYGKADFNIELNRETVQKVSSLPIEQEMPEEPSKDLQLEDGLHAIDASFINAKTGSDSAMARYLGNQAYIDVKNGQATVYFLINDNGTVTKLTVNGNKHTRQIVNGKQTLLGFPVNPVTIELAGFAEYQAPMENGSIHYGKADFNIELNRETIQKVSSLPIEQENPKPEEKPEEPKPEEKPETPEQPKEEITEKTYTIDYVIKHATENKASSADSFFTKPGKLLEKDGKRYLQVTIENWSMIDSLKVNGQAVKVLKEDKTADKAIVQFEVPKNLEEIIQLSMKVSVPGLYEMTHDARLVMDASTLVEDGKKPEPKPEEKPVKPEVPGKQEPEKTENPKQEKPKQDGKNPATNVYNIDYVIKHAKENEASAADNFFVKPGFLLEKDGKYYLQVTINNWSMIDWLKVAGKSVIVISEDKKADTATVQFEVPKNISQVVQLSMKVTVPGLYETEHDARLVMDASSLLKVKDAKEFEIHQQNGTAGKTPSQPSNGEGASSNKGEDPLQKPAFGTNKNGEQVKQDSVKGQSNPQTGEKSNVFLYTILLLGSAILLVIRFRKRQLNG